jgi:hypothetical protein
MLVALGTGLLAAGLSVFDGFAAPAESNRSWAAVPGEVPMPAASPDDPRAYRGARFRAVDDLHRPSVVESGAQEVPWLEVWTRSFGGCMGSSMSDCSFGLDAPYFGSNRVIDGRREMIWFIRTVEPGISCCPPQTQSVAPVAGPLVAVLDVLVLPDVKSEGAWKRGCGPDEVIIVGDNGWRLNRTTGRIEPVEPDDAVCPDDD